MTQQAFMNRSANLGLDARQRRALDLRSYYELTQYATVVVKGVETPSLPWDVDRTPDGRRIPAAFREPSVQLGTSENMVNRLVDLAVGLNRFAVLVPNNDSAERIADVLTYELKLKKWAPEHLVDLSVVGSVVFGCHRPEELEGAFDPVLLGSEWCEPVFVGQRTSPRALELAAEYAEHPGLEGGAELAGDGPEGEAAFVRPVGAGSDDVVFVRYQWPVAEEASAGEHAKRDFVTWHRRDYTTAAIVEYEPVRTLVGKFVEPDRWRPLPFVAHGWGVVPLVWLKGRGARAEDLDGRSIYSPAVKTMTEGADRSASYWTQAAQVSGSPAMTEIDVTDEEQRKALEEVRPATDDDPAVVGVGPRSVLKYRSDGEHPSVGYLEMAGAGVEALETNARKLANAAQEAAGLPKLDPETLKGVLSGIALTRLNEPAVALAGGFRATLQEGYELLADKVGRILLVEGDPDVTEAELEEATIRYRWPRVFELTAQDIKDWTDALVPLAASGLYPRERIVTKLAEVLDDGVDPSEVLEELLREFGAAPPPPEV